MKGPLTAVLVAAALHGVPLAAQWPQWGGPGRDFTAAGALPDTSWLARPPRELWSRPLGEGHSAVVVDGERLYTMFGRGYRETVIAIEAATGRTLWEQAYDVGYQPEYEEYRGPHATPLVVGERLFTVGIEGHLMAFDKRTGRCLWGHQLEDDFGYRRPQSGFSPSPIAYRDLVILPVGGDPGRDVATGEELWRSREFRKASLVLAGDRLLVLGEEGELALVAAAASGPRVLGRRQVLAYHAWTAPTVVGNRIYLRDAERLVALELER